MANTTNQNTPEPLSQRWALILIAGFVAGAVAFALSGVLLAGLGAAGAVIVGMHTIMA
ncbi:hypothetical protein ACIQNV_37215 [Streptomyces hydrogenans]|uniref:hypothetical protein n=1 Tax=Streptomyces hydrogenans TaxID=1873719 RepID=UPI003805FFD6